MNANERTRLDRIEEKIDKLAEAVVLIARAEEKIIALEEKVDDLHEKIDMYDERLRAVEESSHQSKSTISSIVKLGWIVIGALVTAGIGTIMVIK
tara:strand:+ start:2534 stop:2818 length:285 start_codon:yes stop_codon:yes gene_type:complete